MKEDRINEIATSFVNGNISWVKAQLRTKKDVAAVADFMRELGWISELASFLKIMKH